ncbi:MAG: hypothetical protein IJV31_06905 [Clostridia bacterium]|nr:hypothetical protein [Clostridia bacterium]
MKNKTIKLLSIILIIIFCVSISPITMQNDTYYTIPIGKHIIENGIDMLDPFSWHDGLQYTYPHWAYDVLIFLIFSAGQLVAGTIGGYRAIYISTCILAAILGVTIYLVNCKLNKNELISFFITIGTIYILKDYIAARAQLITFILFALEIFSIEKFLETQKKRYIASLILIPILIANLHCAVWYFYFILYLPYIAEYIISIFCKVGKNEVKEKNKLTIERIEAIKKLIIIMIVCMFTGFLTRIGTTPYTYLIKTMQGKSTGYINEHLPMTIIEHIPIIISLVILFAVLIFTKVKIKLRDLFMIGGLLLLMLYSRRQQSMFALIGSVILNRLITQSFINFAPDSIKKIDKVARNKIPNLIISIMVLALCSYFVIGKKNHTFVDETVYPVEMSEWILENLDVPNIKLFNEYNYGSYLLYKGIPVFIDSRADLYTPEFNTKTGKVEDGKDIFTDFMQASGLNVFYEETFEKYGITHAILYKNSKMNLIITNTNNGNYEVLHEDNIFILYKIK